ncbi:MAG TPA: MerR family transcriptional regulator, partial [Clostridiaceae bacterium]|nr:MerR family transcriptional regulator [Clostridiaceae bacterium]
MPDVRNCKRCGRIFNYIGGVQLCPHCREEDEEDFKRIKRYLFENPKATVSEVASELNISIEKIKKFLREERLEIVG